MALGLRSRWGGQVPVPPGPRYGQACDQRAAVPQPRVGPKRDESWESSGVDRAWPASDHSSDTWNSCPKSQGVLHKPFHPHGDWACSSEPFLLSLNTEPLNRALSKGPCFLCPKLGDISYPPPTHSPHTSGFPGRGHHAPAQHRLLKGVGLHAVTPPKTRGRLDGG